MISLSHLYTNEETLQEFVGVTLAIGGTAALLGLIIAIGQEEKIKELEDSIVDVYSDDYLTMKLEMNDEAIDNSIFDNFTLSGKFKQKILSEDGVSLIVNQKTAAYIKQKFGKYPMFQIIGTNKSYKANYNKFIRDHQKLFKGIFSDEVSRAFRNRNLPKKVRVNAEWLYEALLPFLKTNQITQNAVKKVKIKSKKIQTLSVASV